MLGAAVNGRGNYSDYILLVDNTAAQARETDAGSNNEAATMENKPARIQRRCYSSSSPSCIHAKIHRQRSPQV